MSRGILSKRIIIISILLLAFFALGSFFVSTPKSQAYGECSEYGLMVTYDSYSHTCKCMSGYVMGTSVLGQPYCVSADQVCHDKLGIMSRYNSLSNSCECSYGYIIGTDSIGRRQCISQDDQCHSQLGYNSSYDSLSGNCECDYGYIINNGTCEYGNTVCRNEHGLYSSYSSSKNTCTCDSGYTLDDSSQCVKKQNNVYFYLKEVDTDNRQVIIKSEYDYSYYLVKYGIGCLSSSIKRYLHTDLVVNLGTDFYVDTWDKIVLQDDDETCDITNVQRANSSTTLVPEEQDEPAYTYITPAPIVYTPPVVGNSQAISCKEGQALTIDKKKCVAIPVNSHASTNSQTSIWECNEGYKEADNKCVKTENGQSASSTTNIVVEPIKLGANTILTTPQNDNQQTGNKENTAPQKSESKVKTFFRGIGNVFRKIGGWFK